MLNAEPLSDSPLNSPYQRAVTAPAISSTVYFDGLNYSPLNLTALNSPEVIQGTSNPVLTLVPCASSVQANYDILNATGITGGMVYEPKLVGYKRRYVGGVSYDSIKMGNAISDVYDTIKSVLIYAGFDLTEGVITTDQDYKYIDIRKRGDASPDVVKSLIYLPVDKSVPTLPYAIPYYGDTVATSNFPFFLVTADTFIPSSTTWGDIPAIFTVPDTNVELTVVADGTRGIYWYTIAHLVNGKALNQSIQCVTYSNRVPEDMSDATQSCTRYGNFDATYGFIPTYGNMYIYDSINGSYAANIYQVSMYSLFEGVGKFTTPQNGLASALMGNALPASLNYYVDATSYGFCAPALFGPVEGVKSLLVTNPIDSWSVVSDGVTSYIYLENEFYSAMNMTVTEKYALFCPDNFTQLTDFT